MQRAGTLFISAILCIMLISGNKSYPPEGMAMFGLHSV